MPGPLGELFTPMEPGLLSLMPEPRSWLLRHPTRDDVAVSDGEGDGMLPMGKVGLLTSAGGVGKTMTVVELAVATITGRPWLEHFEIDRNARGKVLLALAEEDAEEVHRRLFSFCEALQLTDNDRRQIEERLVVMPLAGKACALARCGHGHDIESTGVVDHLLHKMRGEQYALVVLDPLSRFAGVSIDADNEAATFVVTLLENIAIETGATVLVCHHSSKTSRSNGQADARGATAITDGVRWVATLCVDGDAVVFQQIKSNYSRPMPKGVVLVRDYGGRLRAETSEEAIAAEADEQDRAQSTLDRHVQTIVEKLRRTTARNKTQAITGLKGKKSLLMTAFDDAVTRELIINEGTSREQKWRAAAPAGSVALVAVPKSDAHVCAQSPPDPPGNRELGTSSQTVPDPVVPRAEGNHGELEGTKGTKNEGLDYGAPKQPGSRRHA